MVVSFIFVTCMNIMQVNSWNSLLYICLQLASQGRRGLMCLCILTRSFTQIANLLFLMTQKHVFASFMWAFSIRLNTAVVPPECP